MAGRRLVKAAESSQPERPADFSDCPMIGSDICTYEVPEPLEERAPDPRLAVLRENLSPLPVASYTSQWTDRTDLALVRWEIRPDDGIHRWG